MRVQRAIAAAALGLLLLSGVGVTRAGWLDTAEVELDSITAGQVDLTSSAAEYRLHSRQPADRSFVSSTTCPPASGFTACRIITETVEQERLIVGDRVVITNDVDLSVTGDTLAGTMTISTDGFDPNSWSAVGGTRTMTAVRPSGQSIAGRNGVVTVPIDVGDPSRNGTYRVTTTINTPPANGSSRWNANGQGVALPLGTITARFDQEVPQ